MHSKRVEWMLVSFCILLGAVHGFSSFSKPAIQGQAHQRLNYYQKCSPRASPFPLHSSFLPNAKPSSPQQQPPTKPPQQLSPLEDWCAQTVEEWYQKAMLVKCPFFKRRFVDALDGVDMILRFLVIRHKSLDIFGPPPGHRSKLLTKDGKLKYLSVSELREAIRRDWVPETGMGYYITGNLNTTLFRDDCVFDGPDPDMPVRGLRKYVNAASQLFDRSKSRAELMSLEIVTVAVPSSHDNDNNNHNNHAPVVEEQVVVAKWRMNGVLRLPWKPNLPEWTGSTTYHFDDDGLIYRHEETWDMSVWQAFLETFAPDLAHRVWQVDGNHGMRV